MDEGTRTDKKPRGYYVDYTKNSKNYGRGRFQSRGSNTSNNSRYKDVPDINFNQKGFMITSIDEVKSYLEMRHILEQYFHELYKSDKKENASDNKNTIDDELESELKQLRVTKPFKQVKTHCRNSVFINITPNYAHVDPVNIVNKFFDDLFEKKQIRTSNTNRVLPILDTCRNSVSSVRESVGNLLDALFKDNEEKHYFIEVQTRGNYKLDSDDKQKMIEAVAEVTTEKKPSWKVSRDNADYFIILVLLRHVCCLTIVSDYFKRSKYNVIEFCKDFPIEEIPELAKIE